MARTAMAWILYFGFVAAASAETYDRVASIGDSAPASREGNAAAHVYDKLIDLVRAMDRVTHSSTKIVVRPFARSLKETAAGAADFHLPLIQNDDTPAPAGLLYVEDVNFGYVQFVIYSRKIVPLDAKTVLKAKNVETEPGHESFFSFPVHATYCVPCSLDMLLLGRIDALVVSSDVVDPLLGAPKYRAIHRALYKAYPIRALVPAAADSVATRRYLIEGVKRLRQTGELSRIMQNNKPYSNWHP